MSSLTINQEFLQIQELIVDPLSVILGKMEELFNFAMKSEYHSTFLQKLISYRKKESFTHFIELLLLEQSIKKDKLISLDEFYQNADDLSPEDFEILNFLNKNNLSKDLFELSQKIENDDFEINENFNQFIAYPFYMRIYEIIDRFYCPQSLSRFLDKDHWTMNEITFNNIREIDYLKHLKSFIPEKISRQIWIYKYNENILSCPENWNELNESMIILPDNIILNFSSNFCQNMFLQ